MQMLEPYKEERRRQERKAGMIGIILAFVAHASLLAVGVTTGLKYLYPPTPEPENLLIEFVDDEAVKPVQRRDGTQPTAETVSPDIELVQQSEAGLEGTQQNEARESVVDDFGDVEIPDPPKEKEINTRALFRNPNNKANKDTLAPQSAAEPSDKLKAGHALGNTMTGNTDGTPKANVRGRNTVGTIPKPSYPVQEDGIVVVDIIVDRNGKVIGATPGGAGTTASDPTLWAAARKAAMETYFNRDVNAPVQQSGTITYVFKLKN